MGRFTWILGPLCMALLSACASTSGVEGGSSLRDCEPGELRACDCFTGTGVQICDDDGDDFGECECEDGSGPGGGGASAGSGGGSATSSSSTGATSSSSTGDPCANHCANGVQDCGEGGIDCGAGCATCPYTWDDCAGAGVSNGSEICDDSPFDVYASVPYVLVCMNANGGIGYVASNTGPPDPNDGIQRCQGWELTGQSCWNHLQYIAQIKCDQEQKVVPVDLSGAAGGYLYFGVHDDPAGGGNATGFCVAEQK